MAKVITAIMISMLYTGAALAQCSKPVTYLTKGSETPCTGFLFTPEAEAKVRLTDLDLTIQKDINAIQTRQLEIYKEDSKLLLEQKDLWRVRAEDSTKKLIESENNKIWSMFLYFAAGAAVTTLITYGVNQR